VRVALTWRALAVGLVVAAGLNVAAPYVGLVLRAQFLATNYFPVGLGLALLLVLAANAAARSVRRSWGLGEGELAMVFVMAAVAITVPTHGLVGYLLSFISAPRYLASPENRWAETFFAYLPRWAVVDAGPALRWFYEGLPRGEGVPWGAWVLPLGWWLAFIVAGLFACVCLVSLLRRQWMDHERLAYPLAGMTLEMLRGGEGRVPRFARSGLFWVGFVVPFFALVWNIGGLFTPNWPTIPKELPPLVLGRHFPPIHLVFYWPMVCIAFFLRREVALSIWVCVVLGVIEEGLLNRVGYRLRSSLSVYHFDASRPALAWQSYGAMVVMVGLNLWVARRHLWAMVRRAVRGKGVGDERELLSPRTAVGGFVVAVVFMGFWLWRLGLEPGTAVVFLVAAFVGFLALSRLVVEGGLVFIRPPLTPQSATVTLLGNSALGPAQLTAMGLTMAWVADPINSFMPAAANAAKVGYEARASGRQVLVAMALAVGVGLAVGVPLTLWICYQRGAYTTGTWLFKYAPWVPYNYVVKAIRSRPELEWGKVGWGVAGGVQMALVTFLHHRFSWWPLHPLGLVAGVVFKVRWSFLPVFLGWAAKEGVLRIGGAGALERAKPLFLGLMAGWFAGAGVRIAVDGLFFFGHGHTIYWH